MIVIEMWAELTYPGSIIVPEYLISTNGRIFSKYKNCIMKDADDGKRGYRQISLITIKGKVTFKVHRLVKLTFDYVIGCEQLEVNHINGDKLNNTIYNLEWVTGTENIQKGYQLGLFPIGEDMYNAILTNEQVHFICKCLQDNIPISKIIDKLGPTKYKSIRNVINGILQRKCWRHISSQYTFPLNDSDTRKFTDAEVIKICDYLELNLNYKQILQKLGYDINTIDNTTLNAYNRTISNIRRGKLYKDISQERQFNTQRSCQIFSDEQIHLICKYIEYGLSYDDILIKLGFDIENMEYSTKANYKSILSAIKNKVRFVNISKNYKF